MIEPLRPVWQQFAETYDAIRQALADVPDERLHWRPGAKATSPARIVRHLAASNLCYCAMIEGDPNEFDSPVESHDRERLLSLLAESEGRVRETFEQASHEDLKACRADDWNPFTYEIEGPFDGMWFAQQIVRHSAYHLGQIMYLHLLLEGENDLEAP